MAHVIVNLRFDIDNPTAVLLAGRRSYGRDLLKAVPAEFTELDVPDDADRAITDPADAIVELLVEAWVRCYQPTTPQPPLIDKVEGAEWGDVDYKEYFGPEVTCPTTPQPDVKPEDDIIGCGSTDVDGPDSEGLYDCRNCGIFFAIDGRRIDK